MEEESGLEAKLQLLFIQLQSTSDFPVEDDTVLQKLQSSLQGLIDNKENSLEWCKKIDLLSFVTNTLKEQYIRNEKNITLVSFALHCLSAVVKSEDRFISLSQDEVMQNFKNCYPYLNSSMSSLSNVIRVAESLVQHQAGLNWVIANGVWGNLLTTLSCQNIFIKKSCTSAIINIILNVEEKEKIVTYIRDLEMILSGGQEEKLHKKNLSDESLIARTVAKLEDNSQIILQVFYNLLMEALGKKSLNSSMKPIFELLSKTLFQYNLKVSSQGIITFSKLLLLGIVHKFQEVLFNLQEKCCIDSIISDIFRLARSLLVKDYHKEFLIASFEFHKYWNIMFKNMGEPFSSRVSNAESVLLIFVKLQTLPLRVVCRKYLLGAEADQEKKLFEERFKIWKTDNSQNIVIRDDLKIEYYHLLDLLLKKSSCDPNKENEQCISYLMCSSSAVEHIHPMCASYFVQTLIYLLQFKIDETATLESNPRLYLHSIDILRSLIERYDIDWKTYEAELLFPSLCSITCIPGIATRIKIVSLQTIKSCIEKYIPPLQTRLEQYSTHDKSFDTYFENLEKTVNICLLDVEWEVRDSALELLLSCMKIPLKKREPFVDWFHKLNLLDRVLEAVGDAEPYVQATAMHILAAIVSENKIWIKVNLREMKQKALRAIVRSGETCIRNGGIDLLHSLLLNNKFMNEEIYKFVLPVVQSATSDADDDIRIAAIGIINLYINMETNSIGVVNETSFSTVFKSYEVSSLECEDIQNKVLNVISRFCQNGCFLCVVNCLDDNVRAVSSEAITLLKFVDCLLEKYSLHKKLYSHLLLAKTTSVQPSTIERNITSKTESDERNLSSAEESNPGIEYILQMSDLTAISKLNNDENSSKPNLFWWNGEASEVFLEEEEIPLFTKQVQENCIIQGLKRAYEVIIDNELNFEKEINLLLEDIFLVVGSSQEENESRARDCY